MSFYRHVSINIYVFLILTVPPEIKCGNFSAMSGDKFVDMDCSIELRGIRCTDNILWENDISGEQYKVGPSRCVLCREATNSNFKVFGLT
jgi:hypothetical protein